jgi:hypothetical protein
MTEEERKELYNQIVEHLNSGGRVQVASYAHATTYYAKHISLFKLGRQNAILTKHGKHWLDSSYCAFRFM